MPAQPSPPQLAHVHEAASRPSSANNSDDDDFSWVAPKDMVTLKEMNTEPSRLSHEMLYHQNIKTLPRGTKPVRFVGEGAANAVFEFQVPEGSGLAPDFKGFLLRVAKVPALGQPLTYDYLLQQRFYHSVIKPVLHNHTVHQELVVLRKSNLVNELNKLLQSIDHLRKEKFRGSYVGHSDWGLLLEDMRPEDPAESFLIEFKPKWLCQSPSAPPNAIRCRQCAMELQSFINGPAAGKTVPKNKPCPLALACDAPPEVSSPFRIAPQLADEKPHDHFARVLQNTANHEVMSELRTQQAILDRDGPLNATQSDLHFVLAMTLRDCTCFAQIPRRPSGSPEPLRLRLGDFDWKDPKVKFERWRKAEEDLVKGGFYTAEWIRCGKTYYHPPTLCSLEWAGKRTAAPEIIHIDTQQKGSKKEAVRYDKNLGVYHHKADLGPLESALQAFKKDAPASSDTPCNPHRSEPR